MPHLLGVGGFLPLRHNDLELDVPEFLSQALVQELGAGQGGSVRGCDGVV